MTRLYLRLAWITAQILVEAGVAAISVIGLWTTLRPYFFHRPQALEHPWIVTAIFVATLWIAAGPSPYGRWNRQPKGDGHG